MVNFKLYEYLKVGTFEQRKNNRLKINWNKKREVA